MSEERPTREGSAPPAIRRWADPARLPDWLTAAVAFAIWRVFFPALMSKDSLDQYWQASTGQYNDWHPPLMAVVLKIVMASGGAIGILMLAQCLAGVFGIRALATSVLGTLHSGRIPPRRAAWISFLVLLVLLIPLTPLAFYLMTFWKDAWAMVFLLWIGSLSLDLLRLGPTRRRNLLLAVLGAALGLVRHNAVIVLPLIGLILWMGARRSARPGRALLLAAAPLAICLAATPLIDLVFGVENLHTDSAVMALDLVGLCAESQSFCDRLPWTASHILDPAALAQYRPGDIGFIFWDEPKHVDTSIRLDYPRLRAEYLRAVRELPLPLARIKVKAFVTLLGIDQTAYFFQDSLLDNTYGLSMNVRFAPVRTRLIAWTRGAGEHPVLRWISGVHLAWIVVNVLWLAGLLALWFRSRKDGSREDRYRHLAIVLLLPFGYYGSYLLASPAHDFRFMYPATLLVQGVTLAWLLGWAGQSRSRTT